MVYLNIWGPPIFKLFKMKVEGSRVAEFWGWRAVGSMDFAGPRGLRTNSPKPLNPKPRED